MAVGDDRVVLAPELHHAHGMVFSRFAAHAPIRAGLL